jgi:thioredoxin 1
MLCIKNTVKTLNTNKEANRIVKVGEANFESEVLKSKHPVLAAFLASWSRPCQIIRPVLDEVLTERAGSVKIVEINADDNPDLGLWFDIQSIPTLLYFIDGTLRTKITGTTSKEAILLRLQLARSLPRRHTRDFRLS